MPAPTTLSKRKEAKNELDTSQISAFAVYNNLVPGVKAYQDTSESTPASKRKKKNKKKNKEHQALSLKSQPLNGNEEKSLIQNGNSPTKLPSPPKSTSNGLAEKGKKKKKTKGGSTEITSPTKVPADRLELPVDQSSLEPTSSKKKKKKRKSENGKQDAVPIHQEESVSPNKLRKLEDSKYLPNPLAIKNKVANKLPVVQIENEPAPLTTSQKKKNKKKSKVDSINDSQKSPEKSKNTQKGKPNLSITHNSVPNQQKETNQIKSKKISKKIQNVSKEIKETAPTDEPPNVFAILSSKTVEDSVEHGKNLFEWLLHPQPIAGFMTNHWEKAPLLIKRGDLFPNYYDWIMTSASLDTILRKNVLKYSENVDITSYANGIRETVSNDMQGRARPAAVWDSYSTGHSVRILNPQTYCRPLWRLNSSLQEFLGCFVGANVYLTPPDSQGFAPHYDDIEAFILQLEGKKHWKLYKPRTPNEELPRFSSKDFGKEERSLGKPIMDVILEAGDLLYFPRGIIHQAKTVDGFHSMHVTLSGYQQNSYTDLLKQHLSKSLEKLSSSDVSFRKGLPLDYLSFMGAVHSKSKDKIIIAKRKEFKETLAQLVTKIAGEVADDAADQMGKKFIWDSLPPFLTRQEKDKTVEEDGEFLNNGKVRNRVEIDPDVEVKFLRKNCVRLINEENTVRLYFSIENSLIYHEEEPQFLEVPAEYQKAIEYLIARYPQYTKVEELPMDDKDVGKKIQIVNDLWERGILMTKKPLETGEIDEDYFDFDNEEDLFDDDEDASEDYEEVYMDDDSYDDGFELSDESNSEESDNDYDLGSSGDEEDEGLLSRVEEDEEASAESQEEDLENEDENELDSDENQINESWVEDEEDDD